MAEVVSVIIKVPMSAFWFIILLAAWIILQRWILPRFGVGT